MDYYCFTLNPHIDSDSAWERLSREGFKILYGNEETDPKNPDRLVKMLYGHPPEGSVTATILARYPEIASLHPVFFDKIDWHDQWGTTPESPSLFIDLKKYSGGAVDGISMIPGPGFGDLTHPTTRLVLEMMAPYVKEKQVIDIGSGSGILSLAAVKLGAKGACGIEIDPAAIEHARHNAELNFLESECRFQLPIEPLSIPEGQEIVVLMNMIRSEQEEAWKSLPFLHALPMICFTSGILRSEETFYEAACQARGWELQDTLYDEPWCGFHFSKPSRITFRR